MIASCGFLENESRQFSVILADSVETLGVDLTTRKVGSKRKSKEEEVQDEILTYKGECSGYARVRMAPKLMNCCKPEPMGTQGYGKMLKRIQVLKDGGVPAKEARNWRIEGQKRRITRKEHQRLQNKFEMEGFMAQKGLWNLAQRKRVTQSESTRL